MKICPYCQTQNPDSAVLCTECMKSIGGIAPEREDSVDKLLNEFFQKEEKRDKLKAFLWRLPLIVYYLVYIPLYILAVRKDGGLFGALLLPLLFGGLYYLLVFKPEFLFKLNHMFDIDNIDEVEISDWYFFSSRISGFVVLIAGMIMIASVCMDVYDIEIGRSNAIVVGGPSIVGISEDTVRVSYRFENSGFPSEEELRSYGAIFIGEDNDFARGAFDALYENYSHHIPGVLLFVMDGTVYEINFEGDFLYLFKDELSDGVRRRTTMYPKKLIKSENSYILSGDGDTILLKIDF